jgi:Flp pilus assembly pilin Flp
MKALHPPSKQPYSIGQANGQSLAEYALILTLVAVVCIAGLTSMGEAFNDVFVRAMNTIAATVGG